MLDSPHIIPATLEWREGQPYSKLFEDIYFSTQDGLSESNYVFLQHNALENRFKQLNAQAITPACDIAPLPHFTIAEIGFGTGLNFLATWQLFKQLDCQFQLQFISIEKHPLSHVDFQQVMFFIQKQWQSLTPLTQALLQQYPLFIAGCHRLVFEEGKIVLDLWFSEAVEALTHWQGNDSIDAWFLDGFAPAKNPAPWDKTIFLQIARLSHAHTTFSTFTAASSVRRNLQSVGFKVEKVEGFGQKREMLCGQFHSAPEEQTVDYPCAQAPWFTPPNINVLPKIAIDHYDVLIIGAGIAGCATAYMLAQRGWQVALIDQRPLNLLKAPHLKVGQEGATTSSDNLQGAIYPALSREWRDIPTQFHLAAFLSAVRHYTQLNQFADSPLFSATGVVQLENNIERFQKLIAQLPTELVQILTLETAADYCGFPLPSLSPEAGALWFPQAGWISPLTAQRTYLKLGINNISLIDSTPIVQLSKHHDLWTAHSYVNNHLRAPHVILANAYAAENLLQAILIEEQIVNYALPLQAVRGQVSYAKPSHADLKNSGLKTVVCGQNAYVLPAQPHEEQATYCFGATYSLNNTDLKIQAADNQQNWQNLQTLIPALATKLAPPMAANVGVRCTSLDHLPLIGGLPHPSHFFNDYKDLNLGKRFNEYPAMPHYDGLWVNIAHGSRGFSSAILAAEILTAELNHDVIPLSSHLQNAIAPQRFWVRVLKKKMGIYG